MIYFVSIMLFFANCSGSDELMNVYSNSQFIDSIRFQQPVMTNVSKANTAYYVTKDDAAKFASSMRHNQGFEIDAYTKDGDTLLYIVNYKKGWLIIAGDKRINPIVAEWIR